MGKIALRILLLVCVVILSTNPSRVFAQVDMPNNYHIESAQAVANWLGVSNVDFVSAGPFAYNTAVMVERFSSQGYLYDVDPTTYQIVHFQPISDDNFLGFSDYAVDRNRLKLEAIKLINRIDPKADLKSLSFQISKNDGYFRWEDISKTTFQNGQRPSIEVVYAPDERLFSYTNTLHLDPQMQSNSTSTITALSPVTLAAPGSNFTTTGSTWYTASGGYGGSNYTYSTDGVASRYGKWSYSISESVQSVIAWIPNVSATLASQARYTVVYNNGTYSTSIICNQNLHKGGYCQPIVNGIPNFLYMQMSDATAGSERQACDEVFIN